MAWPSPGKTASGGGGWGGALGGAFKGFAMSGSPFGAFTGAFSGFSGGGPGGGGQPYTKSGRLKKGWRLDAGGKPFYVGRRRRGGLRMMNGRLYLPFSSKEVKAALRRTHHTAIRRGK